MSGRSDINGSLNEEFRWWRGGEARAKSISKNERSRIAKKAAAARWKR
jgi:hypothetical protein